MKILLLTILLFTLSGCASAPTVPVTPAHLQIFKARSTGASAGEIDGALYQTLVDCQGILVGLEQQSTQLKWWGVGIQTAGGLLGSVLLPVAVVANAAKSTITLLGSLAGFANTELSVVRNEGLGAADVIRTRANVQAGMQIALTKYYTARSTTPVDLNKMGAAVDELKVSCISYALVSPVPLAPAP